MCTLEIYYIMDTKKETLIVKAPNIKFRKYELWRKSNFWGNDTYYAKAIDEYSLTSKVININTEKDWEAIKYQIKLVNDLFDYQIGESELKKIESPKFKTCVNWLYGADVTTINYEKTIGGDYYLKYSNNYNFRNEDYTLNGLSASIKSFEILIIAKDLYSNENKSLILNGISLRDLIRAYWGMALWLSAYISGIFQHRYFVFNNPSLIFNSDVKNWLSKYNLIIKIDEDDW